VNREKREREKERERDRWREREERERAVECCTIYTRTSAKENWERGANA
jgi:hypothetical protein